jgi:thioredoxin-related protein
MMQQRKYFKTPFLWPGLFIAGVVVLCFGGRKPDRTAGPGVGTAGAGVEVRAGSAVRAESTVGAESGVSWMSVEQAADKLQQEKRPVLIDLYTTWCGWCRQMDKKTYSNKKVAEYLQDKFYTVKVDAETHAVINWNGKTYQFNPQYRSNEFALYLTHGRLEFPTTIIITPGEEPQAIPGYMEPKELELLVRYFGDGAYKTRSFDSYQKDFKATW